MGQFYNILPLSIRFLQVALTNFPTPFPPFPSHGSVDKARRMTKQCQKHGKYSKSLVPREQNTSKVEKLVAAKWVSLFQWDFLKLPIFHRGLWGFYPTWKWIFSGWFGYNVIKPSYQTSLQTHDLWTSCSLCWVCCLYWLYHDCFQNTVVPELILSFWCSVYLLSLNFNFNRSGIVTENNMYLSTFQIQQVSSHGYAFFQV